MGRVREGTLRQSQKGRCGMGGRGKSKGKRPSITTSVPTKPPEVLAADVAEDSEHDASDVEPARKKMLPSAAESMITDAKSCFSTTVPSDDDEEQDTEPAESAIASVLLHVKQGGQSQFVVQ